MNIVVRPYGNNMCYCRPDTTWERENRDLYSPDCVNEWHWAPVLFARISKAGKCISQKFVERYYDSISFGVLLYAGKGDIAFSSCIDHTSILPSPLYNPVVLGKTDNIFEVEKNHEVIYYTDTKAASAPSIEEAICKASQLTSLRIGDMVAVELAPVAPLAGRAEGTVNLKARFCEKDIFDYKILF